MANIIQTKSFLVFAVSYDYDDYELQQHFHFLEYFENLSQVGTYLDKLYNENKMIQEGLSLNEFYACRTNIKIKISQKAINDKQFYSLFKNMKK